MARGLMAGVPDGFREGAAPGLLLGEGISGAVNEGIGAYESMTRTRLAGEEGQRSQQRLDMAAQLQPGALKSQALQNREKELNLEAAADKVERSKLARDKANTVMGDLKSGKLTDPKDFTMRMLDVAVANGDPEHIEKAMGHYEAMLKDTKLSEDYKGIAGIFMKTWQESVDKPNDPTIWGNAIGEMLQKHPAGAAGSPMFQGAFKRMEISVDNQMPKQLGEPYKQYLQLRVQNPKLSPSAAWLQAGSTVPPELQAKWRQFMPPDVVDDKAIQFEGAKAGAVASAKLPAELAQIRAKGEKDIEVAKVKATIRGSFAQNADDKSLVAHAGSLTKELQYYRALETSPNVSPEEKAAAKANAADTLDLLHGVNAEMERRRAQRGTGAQPAGGPAQPGAAPAGPAQAGAPAQPSAKPATGQVRQQVVDQAVQDIRQFAKSNPARAKQILDHNVANGKISQQEADRVLQLVGK